jgi:hypothetical protein
MTRIVTILVLRVATREGAARDPAANLFAPGWSLLVLLAWPAVVLLAAAAAITRRDA